MQPFIKLKSAKRWSIIVIIMLLLFFFFGLNIALADDLMGADEVILQVSQMINPDLKQTAKPGKEEADRYMRELDDFKAIRAKLPVDEAIDRWLKLYDRFWHLPTESVVKADRFSAYRAPDKDKPSLYAVVAAIPPPQTWENLKKQILLRKPTAANSQEAILKILAYYLTKDKIHLDKSLAELKTNVALGDKNAEYYLRELKTDDLKQIMGKEKEPIDKTFEGYLQSLQNERPEGRFTIHVPDLVSAAGEKRAGELILKAIAIPGLSLKIPSGGETLLLAKRLVTEHAGELIGPQWELVTDIDDTDLLGWFNLTD